MICIGIDPGKKGGIAIISDGRIQAFPYSDSVLKGELAYTRSTGEGAVCCLEQVHAMPKQGVTSMFNFGVSYGYIKGVLEANHIPYQEVTPSKWKKEFGLDGTKAKSIEVCKRLFPGVNLLPTERSRVDNDGMAEALLMAEYARRKL